MRLEGIVQGFSTRKGPPPDFREANMSFRTAGNTDSVAANRRAFCRSVGVPIESLVFMQQCHGDEVAVITRADSGRGALTPAGAIPGTDAMISREQGLWLAALEADCAVVALCDPVKRAVGIAHAGWRGTVKGIAGKTARKMCAEFGCDPATILAGIGPSIGPCCYEVGAEVAAAAEAGHGAEAVSRQGDKFRFDLRRANVTQLRAAGLRAENIEVSEVCTCCERDRFFSYRCDGPTGGRFCGIIGFREGK